MALIRTTCEDCGDVELRSRDLQIRVCNDTGDSTYVFCCPVCKIVRILPGNEQVTEILWQAGVECIYWNLPAELKERPIGGQAISVDDIIDFHNLISDSQDGWFMALASQIDPGKGKQ